MGVAKKLPMIFLMEAKNEDHIMSNLIISFHRGGLIILQVFIITPDCGFSSLWFCLGSSSCRAKHIAGPSR